MGPMLTDANRTSCGINARYEAYGHEYQFLFLRDGPLRIFFAALSFAIVAAYFAWDIATLLLYVFKMRSLKKYEHINSDIYKRISLVMRRIVIMTLFYEIITASFLVMIAICVYLIEFLPSVGAYISGCVMSITYSFSMYLMLDHNTTEYISFLKKMKCICRCSCYTSLVRDQMDMIDTEESKLTHVDGEKRNDPKKAVEETEYETNNVDDQGIEMPKELSLQTMTIVDQMNITNITNETS